MQQYFNFPQATTQVDLPKPSKVTFASTSLTRDAAACWYTLQASNIAPESWSAFKAALLHEFIPEDNECRVRDNLRQCGQTATVSVSIMSFRNTALLVTAITEGEK